MAYTEITTSGNSAVVAQEKWSDECHREYVGNLKMKWLMGGDPSSVIFVSEDLTKKAGDAVTKRYALAQSGGTVRGNSKGTGNEGSMSFAAQRFIVDKVRTLHKMEDVPMTEKRVSFSVKNEMKWALTQKHARTFDDDMVAMLCDTGTTRSAGRYLYGAASSNYSGAHATDLANIDNIADQLTSAIIGMAKRKAVINGTGVTQKIQPTIVKNGMKSEEWFVFLGHTYPIRDLVNNDAAFRNAQLMLPPGSRDNSMFFTGSHFKGSWEGVLIYEYDRMPLSTNTNSIQCAHNLLLGASAGVVAWGQRTKFTDDDTLDYGHDYGAELYDIRNKLVTGSSNNLKCMVTDSTEFEVGLINVFTAAVAD